MKLLLVAIILAVVDVEKVTSQQIFLKEPCTAWRVFKLYQDGSDDESRCYCELQGTDLEDRGKHYQMLPLADMPSNVCQNIIASGTTEILPNQLQIFDNDETDTIISRSQLKLSIETGIDHQQWNASGWNDLVNQNQIMKFTQLDNNNSRRRRLRTTGTRSLLIIRGIGTDTALTKTSRQLADDIFGTEGDPLNLKSQFDACSYGALTFKPAPIGNQGVYDVSIPYRIEGNDEEVLEEAFLNQASTNLDVTKLSMLADNVIVCIPPGTISQTRKQFVAYAYLDGYISVFNDLLCSSPSVVMHEIGHNLGLSHSNEDEGGGKYHYRDQSGLMGYGYSSDDAPSLCFNGVKTYQLGWFSEYHQDLSFSNVHWDGTMVGFVNKEDTDRPMILRLVNTIADKDYYIHFNRKAGFNFGSEDGADKVLVASRTTGTETYSNSLLEAKLGAGQRIKIIINDDIVIIRVKSIRDNANGIREAHVVITSSASPSPSSSPSDAATLPPTPAPTLSPDGCNDARRRRSKRRYLRSFDSRNSGCSEGGTTHEAFSRGSLSSFTFGGGLFNNFNRNGGRNSGHSGAFGSGRGVGSSGIQSFFSGF